MDYVVTGKNFVSPLLLELNSPQIKVISETELKNSSISFPAKTKLYLPSESAIAAVLPRLQDQHQKQLIQQVKDKYRCRCLMRHMYPGFYFKKMPLAQLGHYHHPLNCRFVIKPVKGFFGTGIRTASNHSNLEKISQEINRELKQNCRYFSSSVVSPSTIMIEKRLQGDEFAVDMFYSSAGKPIIMNIYHHPIPHSPYFNVLYYTHHDLFTKFYDQFIQFFTNFNQKLNAKSFAIHAEFIYQNKQLVPVELNPMRFGGFGLADLTYHAFGFSPFKAFFTDFEPNWSKIWSTRKDYYGWVLAYNGSRVDVKKSSPNHAQFKKTFSHLLAYHQLDYLNNPAFAIAYIQEKSKTKLF